MVAVPEVVGVHWKTFSGAVPELPHVPASVLAPLVEPVKLPPPAGMTVALPQAAPARVVEVVLVVGGVVVVVVVVVVVGAVAGRVARSVYQPRAAPWAWLPWYGAAP